MKLLVVLMLLAVLLIACDGAEDVTPTVPSNDASPTFTWTRTPTPVASEPTPWPSQPPGTPMPTPEPLHPPLEIGDPVPFPGDVVLFLWAGCTQCDGPHSALHRFEIVDGTIVNEVVREPPPERGVLRSAWVGDGGALYVTECTPGPCGPQVQSLPVTLDYVYRSTDDGDTWEPAGPTPGEPTNVSEWPDAPHHVPLESADDGRFSVLDVRIDLTLLDPRCRFADGFPPYGVLSVADQSIRDALVLRWYCRVAPGESPVLYTTWFDSDGVARWTVAGGGEGVAYKDGVLLVTRAYLADEIAHLGYSGEAPAWLPSLIDLDAATIHPILDPFLEDPRNRHLIVGIRHLD